MNITKKVVGSGIVLGLAGMILTGSVVLSNGKVLSMNTVYAQSGSAMQQNKQAAPMKMETRFTTAKADNLRILLNALNAEHMNLASNVLRNGYEGTAGFGESFESLDKNSNDLAASVGAVYGPAAQTKFLEIWRSHINYFKDYTVAMKSGDQAGMDTAVEGLATYVNNISNFLSKANPDLPYDAVHQVVSDHVALLKGTIDMQAQGDYAGSYANQRAGDIQIREKIADT
ncbi:MAG: hypothetical protein ABIO02_04080, partial [Patescibacteria group bacterium]